MQPRRHKLVQLCDVMGRAGLAAPVRQGCLQPGALSAGVYSAVFALNGETVRKRLVRQAE